MKTQLLSFKKTVFVLFTLLFASSLFAQKKQPVKGTFVSNQYQLSEIISVKESVPFSTVDNFLTNTFGLTSNDKLVLYKTETDEIGFTHYKYRQEYKGVNVEHVAVTVHVKAGAIVSVSGNFKHIPNFETSAKISEGQGLQAAKTVVKNGNFAWERNPNVRSPKGELVVFADPFSGQLHMAYKYDIYSFEPLYRANVFVDANSGKVLFENNRIHHANVAASGATIYNGTRSFTADQTAPTSFRLRQTSTGNGVETYHANNKWDYNTITEFTSTTATSWPDASAIQAHWASEQTHAYYLAKHSRNSFDNTGSKIISYVHFGIDYVNAFWNGSVMTYGDGDGVSYGPLVSVDIVGHEITHGVTEHTADLIYAREAGALNESFSDIFGESLEKYATGTNDWQMGTDMGIGGSGAIRAMDNPNIYLDPDTYNGTYYVSTTCLPGQNTNDYCGVHTNSGVQNKWFYILCQGESGTNDLGNAYNVTGIGMDKAAAIAYRNLSVYLSPTSGFMQARAGAIQSAIDLYGLNSAEHIATAQAWYAVGVGFGNTVCPPNTICANYVGGNIPSTFGTPAAATLSTCPGVISVNVPAGFEISGVDVFYNFIANPSPADAWMNEQRSKIYCPTNSTGEAIFFSGVGSQAGFYPYSRTGLTFADGLTGTVDFELHLFNTYGSGACSNYYQYVDSGSYSVMVHLVPTVSCSLSGSYTIDAGSPASTTNYQSFSALATDLNTCGISGPVVINVISASGPYTSQFKLGAIVGSSSTNTITINGHGETLQYNATTNSTDRATLQFDGTEYVIVNNLVIKGLGSTSTTHFGWAAHLLNGANNNAFDSCTFEVNQTSSTDNYSAFVCSNSNTSAISIGDAASNLTLKNSTLKGGHYSVALMGSPTGVTGNTIENCTMLNFRGTGVYVENVSQSSIKNNDLSRATRTNLTTLVGIYLKGVSDNNQIIGNKIHNTSDLQTTMTNPAYGIQLDAVSVSNAIAAVVVSNNQIYKINSNGTIYGIFIGNGSDGFRVWYNTIVLDHTSTTANAVAGINITSNPANGEVKNNLIYLSHKSAGTDYVGLRYSGVTGNSLISNFNNVYISNPSANRNYARKSATTYATLGDWQSSNSNLYDQNSTDANPLFIIHASDLTPRATETNNTGTPIASITVDADGAPRSGTTPDMGALEFSTLIVQGELEPNETFAAANPILQNTLIGADMMHNIEVNDYFVTLPDEDGTFKLYYSGIFDGTSSGHFYAYVYNGNESQIGTKSRLNLPIGAFQDSIIIPCRARDTLYLRFHGVGNFSYSFNYTMQNSGIADAEPNESFATAAPVAYNTSFGGRIGYIGTAPDVNDYFYSVPVGIGTIKLFVDYTNTSQSASSHFYTYVYNKNQGQIGVMSKLNVPLGSHSDSIVIYCQDYDTLYFRANSSGCFSYTMRYEIIPHGTNDLEPNGTFATAQAHLANDTTEGLIGYTGDASDYFLSVTPNDGTIKVYSRYFNTSNSGGSHFYTYVYNKNQGLIGSMSKLNVPINTWLGDTITIYCKAQDSIYLRTASSGCFNYKLSYEVIQLFESDSANNNSLATSQAISFADTTSGGIGFASIATDGDDYYVTVAPEDGTLQFITEYVNTSGNSGSHFYAYVYNKNGNLLNSLIKFNVPLGTTHIDTITYHCLASDTIYFRISSSGCFQYRFYQNMINTGDSDAEPNNTLAQANTILFSDTTAGKAGYSNVVTDGDDYFVTLVPDDGTLEFIAEYTNTSGVQALIFMLICITKMVVF